MLREEELGFAQRSWASISRFPEVLNNNPKSKFHKFISDSWHCALLDSIRPAVTILQHPNL